MVVCMYASLVWNTTAIEEKRPFSERKKEIASEIKTLPYQVKRVRRSEFDKRAYWKRSRKERSLTLPREKSFVGRKGMVVCSVQCGSGRFGPLGCLDAPTRGHGEWARSRVWEHSRSIMPLFKLTPPALRRRCCF